MIAVSAMTPASAIRRIDVAVGERYGATKREAATRESRG
jgi:hypothetical protein